MTGLPEDRRTGGPEDRVAGGSVIAGHSLSQWQLIRRRFVRHRLAVAAVFFLGVLYLMAVFAELVAPYGPNWHDLPHAYCPPQPPRVSLSRGLYVYAVKQHVDPITFRKTYVEDRDDVVPLGLLVRGTPYKLWGLIPWDRRLLGVDAEKRQAANGKGQSAGAERQADGPPNPTSEIRSPQSAIRDPESAIRNPQSAIVSPYMLPTFYLLGADRYGRDIFSRIVFGSRVSLSIGIVAIAITFLLGVTIGGVSGYLGGPADTLIQRTIEIINAFPRLPLWLALAAVMPPDWSPLRVYFAITVVLSLLGWTDLARVVRGKLLSLREEDYAVAARLLGARHGRIIFRHLLPGFTSHIIVTLTLSVPGMILGETSLSFLGLGLRPPVVSWGVMLQDCMNMQVVANYPWLLLPVVFIVLVVLGYNFLGDGLRDAADPYATR